MTPKQVAEIVEFILQTKELPDILAKASAEQKAQILADMVARKKELGLE